MTFVKREVWGLCGLPKSGSLGRLAADAIGRAVFQSNQSMAALLPVHFGGRIQSQKTTP